MLSDSPPPTPNLVVISDPGPDPDDVKVILVAGVAHLEGRVALRAVICNGGGQPRARAQLARCLLDHIGARDVPVGVGSAGVAREAQPYEYSLCGYADVDVARLEDGPALLSRVLAHAAPRSLSFVLISSLRDFVDAIALDEPLLLAKTRDVSIMGGLCAAPDGAGGESWAPDTSQNNEFDRAAAAAAYGWCLRQGVPMVVSSRDAVPLLPMQLASSFALRTGCPVLEYLARAQFEGLQGLWRKLCAGELPARCTKQWYFEAFCGVGAERFGARGYGALGADAPIVRHLHGYVKPYDVVALMHALPETAPLFDALGETLQIASEARGIVSHRLLRAADAAVGSEHVVELLREAYHRVAASTAAAAGGDGRGRRAQQRAARPTSTLSSVCELGSRPTFLASADDDAARAPARTPRDSVESSSHGSSDGSAHGSAHGSAQSSEGGGSAGAPAAAADAQPAAADGPARRCRAPAAPLGPTLDLQLLQLLRSEEPSSAEGSLAPSHAASAPSSPPASRQASRVALHAAAADDALDALDAAAASLERALASAALYDDTLARAALVLGVVFSAPVLGALGAVAWERLGPSGSAHACVAVSALPRSLLCPAFALPALALRADASQLVRLRAVTLGCAAAWVLLGAPRLLSEPPAHGWVGYGWAGGWAASAPRAALLHALRAAGLDWLAHAHTLAALCGAQRAARAWRSPELLLRTLWQLLAAQSALELPRLGLELCALLRTTSARAGPAEILLALALPLAAATLGLALSARARHAARMCLRVNGAGAGAALAIGGAHAAEPAPSEAPSRQPSMPVESALASFLGEAGADGPRSSALEVISEAASSFCPMPFSPARAEAAVAAHAHGETVHHGQLARAHYAQLASNTGARGAAPDGACLEAPEQGAEEEGASGAPSESADEGSATLRRRAPSAAPLCDAYVVSSALDDAAEQSAALGRWVSAFQAREGRAPRLYLPAACDDASFTAAQAVAHTPVHLALAQRLLLLAGPCAMDDTTVVSLCVAWEALGRSAALVDVQIAGSSAEDVSATVASVDAFHAANCFDSAASVPPLAPEAAAATGADDAAVAAPVVVARKRASRAAIELAGFAATNRVVRSLLPNFVAAAEMMEETPTPRGPGAGAPDERQS